MSATGAGSPVLVGHDVSMTFRRGREVVRALDRSRFQPAAARSPLWSGPTAPARPRSFGWLPAC